MLEHPAAAREGKTTWQASKDCADVARIEGCKKYGKIALETSGREEAKAWALTFPEGGVSKKSAGVWRQAVCRGLAVVCACA